MSQKKAKKITIIYAIVAFFVMAFLKGAAPGSAIILWSFTNYRILISKSKNDIGLKYEISNDEIKDFVNVLFFKNNHF